MSDLHARLSSDGFFYYDELTSTNLQLRQLMREHSLDEMSVVVAAFQQAGRGQAGNSWESERGKNLLMSLLLYPQFVEIMHQFGVSAVVSLAVVDALKAFGIDNVKVKWPNDIYINDRKVAGILIEHSIMGPVLSDSIVGIGLNVNQARFLSDAPNPVSMCQVTGTELSLTVVFDKLMDCMVNRYQQLMDEGDLGLMKEYCSAMWRADGQLHSFKDETGCFEAKIDGVDEIGRIRLMTDSGEVRVFGFKEVTYL
jgi:BirA family biotin operon repressor/biotin-[acetyl-CoA-carboxylase] ligase